MNSRFHKLDTLNLKEVETELEILMAIDPDTMSDETIDYVTKLINVANALGTRKVYWCLRC